LFLLQTNLILYAGQAISLTTDESWQPLLQFAPAFGTGVVGGKVSAFNVIKPSMHLQLTAAYSLAYGRVTNEMGDLYNYVSLCYQSKKSIVIQLFIT
jgi:hypothetical protein